MLFCGHHVCVLSNVLQNKAVALSSGSQECLRASISDAISDSQTSGAHVPTPSVMFAGSIISSVALISHHSARRPNRFTHPPLANLIILYKVHHSFPLGCGRHHFVALISFSIMLSSMASFARQGFAFKPLEGPASVSA